MPETLFSKIFFVLLVGVLCVIAAFFYGDFLWAIIDGKTGWTFSSRPTRTGTMPRSIKTSCGSSIPSGLLS